MLRPLAGAVAMLMLVATPVAADSYGHRAPMDQIVLQLAAEKRVVTTTALVTASVDATIGSDGPRSGDEAAALLDGLVEGVEWQVMRFDRSRDSSDLERWRITAEARVPEAQLAGIYDRARSISRPGTQVRIGNVDFSPTLEARQETLAELRAEIYRRAAAEADAVSAVWPDRSFRVHRIDFGSTETMPQPRPMMARMAAEAAPATAVATDVGVAERMRLDAVVVIATDRPDRRGRGEDERRRP